MLTIHNPIAAVLAEHACMILDGGLATELERRGADLNDPLWSAKVLLEQSTLIRSVHYDYFLAGADVATTASYQASFAGFARHGIGPERGSQLLRESVLLALAARDDFMRAAATQDVHSSRLARPLVAASIGPYGATLADGSEYRGQYWLSDAELTDFHRPRMRVLASAGPDLLACETLPSLREAQVLARLLAEIPASCAWISFSCRNDTHTCEGQDIADCVGVLNAYAQVVAVGVNCTAPGHVPSLLRRMRAHTDKPLLAYPNHWQDNGAITDAPFASQARAWYDAGARLIGGCCRTTPSDIHAIRESLAACA